MKRFFVILGMLMTMLLSSSCYDACYIDYNAPTTGVVTYYSYSYWDSGYGYPVVYVDSNPFYRIWYYDRWVYRPVPSVRIQYIVHLNSPRRFEYNHRIPSEIRRYNERWNQRDNRYHRNTITTNGRIGHTVSPQSRNDYSPNRSTITNTERTNIQRRENRTNVRTQQSVPNRITIQRSTPNRTIQPRNSDSNRGVPSGRGRR